MSDDKYEDWAFALRFNLREADGPDEKRRLALRYYKKGWLPWHLIEQAMIDTRNDPSLVQNPDERKVSALTRVFSKTDDPDVLRRLASKARRKVPYTVIEEGMVRAGHDPSLIYSGGMTSAPSRPNLRPAAREAAARRAHRHQSPDPTFGLVLPAMTMADGRAAQRNPAEQVDFDVRGDAFAAVKSLLSDAAAGASGQVKKAVSPLAGAASMVSNALSGTAAPSGPAPAPVVASRSRRVRRKASRTRPRHDIPESPASSVSPPGYLTALGVAEASGDAYAAKMTSLIAQARRDAGQSAMRGGPRFAPLMDWQNNQMLIVTAGGPMFQFDFNSASGYDAYDRFATQLEQNFGMSRTELADAAQRRAQPLEEWYQRKGFTAEQRTQFGMLVNHEETEAEALSQYERLANSVLIARSARTGRAARKFSLSFDDESGSPYGLSLDGSRSGELLATAPPTEAGLSEEVGPRATPDIRVTGNYNQRQPEPILK